MFVVVSEDGTQLSPIVEDQTQAEIEACWIMQFTAWQNLRVVETS
jgi:hypothetical protein